MASLADATPPIALGALDGRYRGAVAPLVDHLSEPALNRERVRVEVEWLIFLTTHQVVPGVRALTDDEQQRLRQVVDDFGAAEIEELATIERETQHDVKAVEYFLKRRLTAIAPGDEDRGLAELIHFCCTSEDINNLSYALMVKGAVQRRLAAARHRARRVGRHDGLRPARRAAARAHPRPARDADDDGQGARRPGAPARSPAAPDRQRPSSSASSTARPAPTAPTSPPCPTPTGRP